MRAGFGGGRRLQGGARFPVHGRRSSCKNLRWLADTATGFIGDIDGYCVADDVAQRPRDRIAVAVADDLICGTPSLRAYAARGSAPTFSAANVQAGTGCGSWACGRDFLGRRSDGCEPRGCGRYGYERCRYERYGCKLQTSPSDAPELDASSRHASPRSWTGTFTSSGASSAQEKARNAASRQVCKGRKTSAGGRTACREMRLYSECWFERARISQTRRSPVAVSSRQAPWVAASSGWSSRFPASFGRVDRRDHGVGGGWEPVAESLVLGAFHRQELREAAFSTGTGGNAVFGPGGDARRGISQPACCACHVWLSWDVVHRRLSGTGNVPPTDRTPVSAAAPGLRNRAAKFYLSVRARLHGSPKKPFSLGGRCFSADVNCVLSSG
jgi:hypothetical protein